MDKIICNVCGTSYPETSGQCPICGYVKPSRAKSAAQEDGSYTYIKGGRFSNTNVKRRNQDRSMPAAEAGKPSRSGRKSAPNMAMGIVAILLLFAVIGGLIFFVSKVLDGFSGGDSQKDGSSQTVQTTRDPDENVLCQELHTDTVSVELAEEGSVYQLLVTPAPADTTEAISYSSLDPDIASVDSLGKVTAVSGGETAITVRCGSATLIISINCSFEDESATWSMNRKDITLSQKGETWDLYSKSSTVPKNKITWTSDDETIAKIEDGIVEAVGPGSTKVHGTYKDITYTCTIRCKLPKEESESEKDDESTTEGTEPEEEKPTVKISHTDVTLRPDGEANDQSFYLYLRDGNGKKLDVTWTPSHEGYVTIDGNKITAIKAGEIISVTTTYEGVTYECVIRLK